MVQLKRAVRINHVKNQISDRHLLHKLGADFFPSKSLLECTEGLSSSDVAGLRVDIPRHNLSIQDRFDRQAREGSRYFGKSLRDFVAGTGEDSHLTVTDMSLRANSIIFVFN